MQSHDDAAFPGSQYSITLPSKSSRVSTFSGCPLQSVHDQNAPTRARRWSICFAPELLLLCDGDKCELADVILLYGIPSALLLLIAIVIAVAAAGAGQIYVHRRFSDQDFVQHNEVGGFIIAVVGTLYAVRLCECRI
jgi:hypothetical protein